MENNNVDNTTQEQEHEDIHERMGLISRIIGVFLYPGATFQQLARRPDWLVPLLITAILGTAVAAISASKMDMREIINSRLEQSGSSEEMSQAQKDQIVRFAEISGKASFVCAPVGVVAVYLISAAIYFGVLKIFSGQATFKQTFSVLCYSSLISIISSGIAIAILVPMEPGSFEPSGSGSPLKTNLTIFLSQDQVAPFLYNCAKFVDFFVIWQLILVTIGLSIVNKISAKKVGACVFVLWLVFSLVMGGLATLGPMVQNLQQGGA